MKKQSSFFWTSYSDLMTSLFFVMLVLFILTVGVLVRQVRATEAELKKIEEIHQALRNIDDRYFVYNEEHKKHILQIDEIFDTRSANMMDLSENARTLLRDAGQALVKAMSDLDYEGVSYLIVIEGQASRDNSPINDELSYRRAIALRNFWFKKPGEQHVDLNKVISNCEIIIAGSGQYGVPREKPDIPPANQRFLVTIIPKIGQIN